MLNIQKEKEDKEIFNKYEKLVLNYFYSKTSDPQLSKDLSAETMSKIVINYRKKLNKKTLQYRELKWDGKENKDKYYKRLDKLNLEIMQQKGIIRDVENKEVYLGLRKIDKSKET